MMLADRVILVLAYVLIGLSRLASAPALIGDLR
jgi:hypothetical protein